MPNNFNPKETLDFGQPLVKNEVALPEDKPREGAAGYRLYEEYASLFRDLKLAHVWRQFSTSIAQRPLRVVSNSDSQQDRRLAEIVGDTFKELIGAQVVEDLLGAEFYGWSLLKLKWARIDGLDLPVRALPQDITWYRWVYRPGGGDRKERFPYDYSGDFELRSIEGEKELRRFNRWEKHFVEHTSNFAPRFTHSPLGRGWGELFWWWIKELKLKSLQAWSQQIQEHGLPVAALKDSNPEQVPIIDEEQQAQFWNSIEDAFANRGLVDLSGKGIQLEYLNPPGSIDASRLPEYIDKLIALFVLGPTLASESGHVGSQALGTVHQEQSDRILKDSADKLKRPLSRIASWIREANNIPGVLPQIYLDFSSEEDLDREIDRWSKLVNIGYQPTPEKVEEVLGKGFAPVSTSFLQGEAGEREQERRERQNTPREFAAAAKEVEPPPESRPESINFLTRAAIDRQAAPLFDESISLVKQFLEGLAEERPNASDQELLRLAQARLPEVFEELPNEKLAELLGAALTGSNMAGRDDAREELDKQVRRDRREEESG
jgi:hypothetical protein